MIIYTAFFTDTSIQGFAPVMFYASDSGGLATALISGAVTLEVNGAGTFDFSTTAYNLITKYLTGAKMRKLRIDVYKEEDGEQTCLFSGYPSSVEFDTYNVASVKCDGLLSVLSSVIVQPFLFDTSTPADYFRFLVGKANANTFRTGTAPNLLAVGTVTPPMPSSAVYREYKNAYSALELLGNMIETCGGYLVPHYSAGGITLDWMETPAEASQQNIMQGVNLVELSTELDTANYYSGIYAIGAEVDGVALTFPWTDTATAQSGGGYLYKGAYYRNASDIQQHSRTAIVKYDEVTTAAGLLTAVRNDLARHASVQRLTSVTAVDVGYISNEKTFKLFQTVRILSDVHEQQHDIGGSFIITKLRLDLCNPEDSTIVVDTQHKTFTSMTSSGSASASNDSAVYKAGDTIEQFTIWTGGFVTESKTHVRFMVPLSKPIAAKSVTATLTLQIRQNGAYTHGSSGSVRTTPDSVDAYITPGGLRINAVFSDTTNAVNNAPAGIAAYISINFQ